MTTQAQVKVCDFVRKVTGELADPVTMNTRVPALVGDGEEVQVCISTLADTAATAMAQVLARTRFHQMFWTASHRDGTVLYTVRGSLWAAIGSWEAPVEGTYTSANMDTTKAVEAAAGAMWDAADPARKQVRPAGPRLPPTRSGFARLPPPVGRRGSPSTRPYHCCTQPSHGSPRMVSSAAQRQHHTLGGNTP